MPGPPTVTTGNGSLLVEWTVPADNGGSDVTGYDVEYRVASALVVTSVSYGATVFSDTLPNLLNGTTYEVRVRAKNIGGAGAWSEWVAGIPATVPVRANAPVLTSGDRSLSLLWSAPADNGRPINDYDVQYRTESGGPPQEWNHDGPGTSAEITGLTNGQLYGVRVRAANEIGTGDWSAEVSGTWSTGTPAGPPLAPGSPTLVAGDASLAVSWIAPGNNGDDITDYDVEYRLEPGGGWMPATHDGTATTASISGLTNGSPYGVRVRAVNSRGNGDWSPTATATPFGPPAAPARPSLVPDDGQITVNWNPPNDGGRAITDYDVEYRPAGAPTWIDANHEGIVTTTTVASLTNGSDYNFRVRAENESGDGDWSPAATSAPTDTPLEAAGVVAAVTLQVDSPVAMTVAWTASPNAERYRIEWIGPGGNFNAPLTA